EEHRCQLRDREDEDEVEEELEDGDPVGLVRPRHGWARASSDGWARPARHQLTSAPSTITFAITYNQTSRIAGPESVCSTGLCLETPTYNGKPWNVASRITAAVTAPGSTSRS